MSLQRDSHNSAASRRMVEKPPRMHLDKAGLLALLQINGIDLRNVISISYLGNRIVGSNAGRRFILVPR